MAIVSLIVWNENIKWACIGVVVGGALVSEAVVLFLGPGGMMPDDRTPIAYGIPIGTPLGAYLGWRIGPDIGPWLGRLLRRR